jgi:hypothetical protein
VLPSLEHLSRLCDDTGLIEHAWHSLPRRDSGYTTDDNGRLLVVIARTDLTVMGERAVGEGARLGHTALAYLKSAALPEGHGFRNRMSYERRWVDTRGSDDSYGRAMWGLGAMAARTLQPELREAAHDLYWANAEFFSTHSRAVAYALIGAVEMADLDGSAALRRHIRRLADQMLPERAMGAPPGWHWPEQRLTYDNARLPEAIIGAGRVLSDQRLIDVGLGWLRWLVSTEMSREGDWFSFTPVGGRGPGDTGPAFDQQPLEAWAMMDACVAATRIGLEEWLGVAERAVSWFLGRNDLHQAMVDFNSGAGFDGLTRNGPNRNQGAESSLAAFAATSNQTAGLLRRR